MNLYEILEEYSINISPQTIKEFISCLLCKPPNELSCLFNTCFLGVCDICDILALLGECLHEKNLIEFG
jgi:hypothetical protein